jgi:hypothetical protein
MPQLVRGVVCRWTGLWPRGVEVMGIDDRRVGIGVLPCRLPRREGAIYEA